ncbi:unnamed protein product [Phytophthora fragariaefolia]|uniref:Unnamed protein product n=1 Tax=Phytophthora fragariaefolia TaxID=1490495 RepID=A0A9W7CVG6_9STRA|nr:unnamed protein product [Phytophthora fragariaefolia]
MKIDLRKHSDIREDWCQREQRNCIPSVHRVGHRKAVQSDSNGRQSTPHKPHDVPKPHERQLKKPGAVPSSIDAAKKLKYTRSTRSANETKK